MISTNHKKRGRSDFDIIHSIYFREHDDGSTFAVCGCGWQHEAGGAMAEGVAAHRAHVERERATNETRNT